MGNSHFLFTFYNNISTSLSEKNKNKTLANNHRFLLKKKLGTKMLIISTIKRLMLNQYYPSDRTSAFYLDTVRRF